jgi:hypothetical protein
VGGYGAAIKALERAHRPESHREPRAPGPALPS